ncbi:HAD family phosphatase [soil metagenome]
MSTAAADSPSAVVLDLGNVLIDWDPHPAIAAGLGPDEATRFLTASDFDFLAWNHLQDAGRGWDEAEAEVARTHPHWAEHARAYRANFGASLVGTIDGSVEVLRDLHVAGVPLLALTNWSHEFFPHALKRFDFLELFDDVVVSGIEGMAKPDLRVFDRLRARAGRPLESLVFVDDRPENVEAARRAGLDGIVFETANRLRIELRDRGLPL